MTLDVDETVRGLEGGGGVILSAVELAGSASGTAAEVLVRSGPKCDGTALALFAALMGEALVAWGWPVVVPFAGGMTHLFPGQTADSD